MLADWLLDNRSLEIRPIQLCIYLQQYLVELVSKYVFSYLLTYLDAMQLAHYKCRGLLGNLVGSSIVGSM